MRFVNAVLILTLVASTAPVQAADVLGNASVRWICQVPFLPDYKAKASEPDVGEGVTYLYAGDNHLRANYGAEASFIAPRDGRRGWYDSAVRLGPLNENNGSVQIEISRWERFDYKSHVAIAWAVPHGKVVEYRDTGLMLADGVPHRLGVYVRDGILSLYVDRRVICTTRAANFVAADERKYFQIRTETSVVGSNGGARVANLFLKRDVDAAARPYATDCILRRHGIFWEAIGDGRFAARGAFYPNEATLFTGTDPTKSCRT